MSTATKLGYLNETKSKIKDNINLTGAGLTNQTPFRQYATGLKTALLNILNNGIDTLYNNFPQTTGTGTNITLNNTLEAPIKSELLGNTSQNGTPTPDAPIPVQVVSGDNTIKVEGKNIYTDEIEYNNSVLAGNGTINSATGFIISKSISIDISKDIYVSFVAGSLTDKAIRVGYYDGNDNFISRPNFETTPTKLTPPSNAQYLRLSYDARNFSNVQVEYNQATTYESYQGQTYPINIGDIELCKIEDYQDRIYKDNRKWYIEKQIGKVVLDGSENWATWYQTSNSNISFYYTMSRLAKIGNESDYNNALKCNRFSESQTRMDIYYGTSEAIKQCGNTGNQYIALALAKTRLSDWSTKAKAVESLKAWLSSNKPIVYYVLATPAIEEITDSTLLNDLNNLEDAKSYNGTTNITITAETPADIKITALKNE